MPQSSFACAAVFEMEHDDLVGDAIATEEAEYIRAYVFDAIAIQVRSSGQVGFAMLCKGSLPTNVLSCARAVALLFVLSLYGRELRQLTSQCYTLTKQSAHVTQTEIPWKLEQ